MLALSLVQRAVQETAYIIQPAACLPSTYLGTVIIGCAVAKLLILIISKHSKRVRSAILIGKLSFLATSYQLLVYYNKS